MKDLQPTKLYRVVSRKWRAGYVTARSSTHAVNVAIATGLHKEGKHIVVWELSLTGAPEAVVSFCRNGEAGRVHKRWGKFTMLRKEETR